MNQWKSRPETKQTEQRPTTTASGNRFLQTADTLRPNTGFISVKSQTITNGWNYRLTDQPVLNFGRRIQMSQLDDEDQTGTYHNQQSTVFSPTRNQQEPHQFNEQEE